MTDEYTGWDNYIKEQEQKWNKDWILKYDPEKWKTSEEWIGNLLDRVKDLERWRHNVPNVVIKSVRSLEEKVKALEERIRYDHNLEGQPLFMTQREVEKLQDRVKDLERKTVFDIFDTEACLNRIEKLEEWKKNTLEHRFGQRINELEDKTETLEEWHKQEHINKSTDTALAKVWMQDLTQLKEKVKDLEEWKRLHLTTSHFNKCYEPEIVPIDKKVWEQIKHLISQIDNHDLTFGGGMSYLKDAIKKAEGSND